jgi:hypothetical protein
MPGIRFLIVVVSTAIVAVVVLPMLVLLDLAGGGTGFGLCPGGLASCRSSYFDGPELAGILVLVLILLYAVLRSLLRARGHSRGGPIRRR